MEALVALARLALSNADADVRKRLNCWLVAMSLWLMTHGKQYAAVRRSHAFRGKIPHFLYAYAVGWRYFKVIEFVPIKNLETGKRSRFFFWFPGKFRVIHCRIESVRCWATEAQALADYYFKRP